MLTEAGHGATPCPAFPEECHLNPIKLVDPKFTDLTCGIQIDPAMAPAPKPAAPEIKTYTVQPGETLSKIAKKFLGNSNAYMKIFDVLKDPLRDPNKIKAGQVLKAGPISG